MRVGIVIPTYNRLSCIGRSIDSEMAQDYDDFVVYVFDNNSIDGTMEYIYEKYSYELSVKKLIYVRHNKNLGMIGNWNSCLDIEGVDLIKFLFSDDTIEQNFLSETVPLFKNIEIGMVTTGLKYCNERGEDLEIVRYYSCKNSLCTKSGLFKSIVGRNSLSAPTNSIYRLSIIKKKHIKFVDNPVAADLMFMADILRYSECYGIRTVLAKLFISKNTVTSSYRFSIKWILDNLESKSHLIGVYNERYERSIIRSRFFDICIIIYSMIVLASISNDSGFSIDEGVVYKLKNKGVYNPYIYFVSKLLVSNNLVRSRLFKS